MNFRVLCILYLLIAGLALLPAPAVAGMRVGLRVEESIPACSRAIISSQELGQAHQPRRGHDNSDSQIQQASDVAMYGSVVTAADVALLLIGTLHHHTQEHHRYLAEPPTREVLFKELFRVIIAPNAP